MEILGSNIAVNLKTLVNIGPGSNIPVNLTDGLPPFVPCDGQWQYKPAADVSFDLEVPWSPEDSLEVDFDFECIYHCTNFFPQYYGNQVPVRFGSSWQEYYGDRVPITFSCEDDEGTSFTFFTGTFDFGEGTVTELDITQSWVAEFLDGAYATFDLYQPPTGIALDFYEGAGLDVDFLRTPGFVLPVYDGAEATAVLNTDTTFDIDVYADAMASAVLTTSTAPTFAPLFYEGAEASALLNAFQTIDDVNFYEGGMFDLVFTTNPIWEPTFNFFEGATLDASLRTQSALQPLAYEGGTFDADITINPAPEMLRQAYDGSSVEFVLSIAQAINNVSMYEGASASISITNDQFWNFYEGATLEVGLATETTLPSDAYAGESVSIDIDLRPSEGIGQFRAYEGAEAAFVFKTLPQILLYPNEIKFQIGFNYDILGFGGIDLNNTSCCPIKESHERIELTAGPAPDERYDGDKVVFTVELSALPRFSMHAYEGALFSSIEPQLLTFNFYDGTSGGVSSIIYDEYNFNLCPGNFIPDGDFVNVELIASDTICNDADLMAEGAFMELDLQANPQFQIPISEGAIFNADITLSVAWILNAYEGAYVRVSNPEFSPFFYDGPEISFEFEEKDITGYSGEFTQVVLSTDYDVEFLELGCLENEFVPTNENGDPDWERFNPVPVELEFFSHSIKARCF